MLCCLLSFRTPTEYWTLLLWLLIYVAKYLLVEKKGIIHVITHKDSGAADVLKSFVHALVMANHSGKSISLHTDSQLWIDNHYDIFIQKVCCLGFWTNEIYAWLNTPSPNFEDLRTHSLCSSSHLVGKLNGFYRHHNLCHVKSSDVLWKYLVLDQHGHEIATRQEFHKQI